MNTLSAQMAEIACNYNVHEFVHGQRDCKNGVPHKDGTESYNAGYSAQYQLEQINGVMCGRKH